MRKGVIIYRVIKLFIAPVVLGGDFIIKLCKSVMINDAIFIDGCKKTNITYIRCNGVLYFVGIIKFLTI